MEQGFAGGSAALQERKKEGGESSCQQNEDRLQEIQQEHGSISPT
jgi:hypothetical protein